MIGETVQGNGHWYETDHNCYVWSGACGAFVPTGLAPPPGEGSGETVHPGAGGIGAVASPTGRPVPIVVDIYHYDRVSGFAQAYNAGVRGVIHKATTGSGGRDDQYHNRRQAALDAGLLWGAYHWGTAAPANVQADNFLQWTDPDEHTLVALDFEVDHSSQMTLEGAHEFLAEIEQRLGRKAVLYSGSTIKGALGSRNDSFFGSHRLWLAQYGSTPRVQASWSSYWLWQYTDGTAGPAPHSAPGIPGDARGNLDCNHFAGTEDELREQWAS